METNDIVTRLREKYSGQLPICSEAASKIEKLRSLVSELLPFMLNDMEQGLVIGEPPFEKDHCKDESTLCPDCQWFEQSTLWKKRVDAGEFKDFL